MTTPLSLCKAAAVICCLASPAAAQGVSLSADQMRGFANQLLQEGDAPRAVAVTEALLLRNPNDIGALLIRSQASLAIGETDAAIAAAAAAYRAAKDKNTRYVAARLAARAHASVQADTIAQIWLRRARENAPNEAAAVDVAEDYRFLRQRNPWSTRLSFGVTPSGNVNNGSTNATTQAYDVDDDFLITLFFLGIYDPSTGEFVIGNNQRALSGVEVSAGVDTQYRLRQSPTSITHLEFSANGRTAILSSEAKEAAPTTKGSDFAFASLSFGVSHRWITAPETAPWSLNANVRKDWFGGDAYSTTASLRAAHSVRLSEENRLRYGLAMERTFYEGDRPHATKVSGNVGISRRIDDGRFLNFGVRADRSQSDFQDADYRSLSLFGSYDLGRPVENIAVTLGGSYEDRLYAETFYGPDERSEQTASLTASFFFEDIEYYGFSPVMTLRASRTDSNIKQFQREDLGISFDVRSSF